MGNYVKIGLIAFIAVWAINHGLRKFGAGQYAA